MKPLLLAGVVAVVVAGTSVARSQSTVIYDGILFGYPGQYDYAPAIVVDGGLFKTWWCSHVSGHNGDVIGYRTAVLGGPWSAPVVALQSTPVAGAWDGLHTCDPSVVKGTFSYGGASYSYAMYYAGADGIRMNYTEIGVAFSNNGTSWIKGPNPIITSVGPPDGIYGAGVPTFYRLNGTAASGWLMWWDSTRPLGFQNVYAFTTDGVNFGPPQPLDSSVQGIIGDIAYSPTEGVWYATTGVPGTSQLLIYSSANPLAAWTQIGAIDSSLTGNTNNHNPGFVRYPNGDLWVAADGAKYVSFGTGGPGPLTWDLGYAHWY